MDRFITLLAVHSSVPRPGVVIQWDTLAKDAVAFFASDPEHTWKVGEISIKGDIMTQRTFSGHPEESQKSLFPVVFEGKKKVFKNGTICYIGTERNAGGWEGGCYMYLLSGRISYANW